MDEPPELRRADPMRLRADRHALSLLLLRDNYPLE